MNHWLAKSRAVLEIDNPDKLIDLLTQQRAELSKIRTGFGKSKMGFKVSKDNMAERRTKKNIARIETRLSQLRLKGILPK